MREAGTPAADTEWPDGPVAPARGDSITAFHGTFGRPASGPSAISTGARPNVAPTTTPTSASRRIVARSVKRSTDVCGSALLLAVLSPLLAAVAVAIRLNSRGPVLFRQQRSGLDGRLFTMVKFRSMVADAEARKSSLTSDCFDGRIFKLKQDPRITRVGAVLRRYSLDELPQLVNVLKGDMSLVGPRPYLPHETATFDATARRRLSMRPGMTGLGQVSGRADLSWDETLRLDLAYVDRWSPMMDLAICLRTFGAAVGGRGAY